MRKVISMEEINREIPNSQDAETAVKVLLKSGYKENSNNDKLRKEEEPPLTCHDCGEPLTDDEVASFYNDIEDDDDKPYCGVCSEKMRREEYTGGEQC